MEAIEQPVPAIPPIFIISGGAGALGKHVARIALSQFTGINPQIIVIPQICSRDQLAEAIAQVVDRRGIIIHTMVDPKMRQALSAHSDRHDRRTAGRACQGAGAGAAGPARPVSRRE